MAKQFKSRYANSIAAIFVLAVVVLVLLSVLMVGRAQRWFQPVRELTIVLPDEGSLGLREGSEVLVLGTNVGTVDAIRVNDQGGMTAEVSIRSDFFRYLRADSVAVVRRTFGVAGDAYVEISRGSGAVLPEKGATIQASVNQAPTAMVGDTLEQIRNEAVPALKEMRAAIVEYTRVAQEFRDPKSDLNQILARANRVSEGLERGEGLAGRLLKDPTLANRSDELMARVNASAEQLQMALSDARKLIASLSETAGTLQGEARKASSLMAQSRDVLDETKGLVQEMRRATSKLPELVAAMTLTAQSLPSLVLQAQDTIRQMGRLMEGAQRSWLIRRYMRPDDPGARIRPEAINAERGGP